MAVLHRHRPQGSRTGAIADEHDLPVGRPAHDVIVARVVNHRALAAGVSGHDEDPGTIASVGLQIVSDKTSIRRECHLFNTTPVDRLQLTKAAIPDRHDPDLRGAIPAFDEDRKRLAVWRPVERPNPLTL